MKEESKAKDRLEAELQNVRNEQKSIIINYCDSIGCKHCSLWEPDNNCYSIQLQNRECNIEEKLELL